MKISRFDLERHFARHEFSAGYLLSSSDCEPLSLRELLAMADAESLGLWEGLNLGYTESRGHLLLRASIAGMYDTVDVDGVLVVAPEEGIFLLMNALLEPGDHVICAFPAYQSLYEIPRSIGCTVSFWRPEEARGWRFDVGDLEAQITGRTRLVVVNFPHNPTGATLPGADFRALAALLGRRGIFLLSDEMYRPLEVEAGTMLPSACDLYERAFSLSGLSKAYGLPGLRVGWLATQDGVTLERAGELRDYTTICGSAPSEILAIMALRNRASIVSRQTARLRRNAGVLDGFFDRHPELFRWNRPVGGSVCFPRMLRVNDTCLFCEALLEHAGIMLLPSSVFHYGRRHVRIGLGREDLPEVIERLAAYLERRAPSGSGGNPAR